MRFIYGFVMIAIFNMNSSQAMASSEKDDKIKYCFEKILAAQDYPSHVKMAGECYEKAKPFEFSDSLTERSLYLKALSFFVSPITSTYQNASEQLTSYYKKFLGPYLIPERLRYLTNIELQDVFDGVDSGLSYSPFVSVDEIGLDKMVDMSAELIKRQVYSQEDIKEMFDLFLQNSEWGHAKNMSLRWPELGFVPSILFSEPVSSSELGFYTLSKDLSSLKLEKARLHVGPQILMFGDCHFAIDLICRIGGKPDLNLIMKQIGIVLAGAGTTDFAEIDSLRKTYSGFELHPLHKQGLWAQSGFNIFESPNLVFLLDGVPKFKMIGSSNKNVEQFCAGLASIGITTPGSCK